MNDLLYISYDDSEKDMIGVCIGRPNKDGSHSILKMELGEQAELIYKLLTEQSVKIKELGV
jgi:hypothetical protein